MRGGEIVMHGMDSRTLALIALGLSVVGLVMSLAGLLGWR